MERAGRHSEHPESGAATQGRLPAVRLLATALVLFVALAVAGCAGGAPEGGSSDETPAADETAPREETVRTEETTADEETAVEETTAAPEEDTVRQGTGGPGAPGEPGPGEVVVLLRGDAGVGFTGTCSAGAESEPLEGEVPARFVYRPAEGEAVECEISKTGEPGTLRIILESEGQRFVQRTDAEEGELRVSMTPGDGSSTSISSQSNTQSTQSSQDGQSSATSSSSVVVEQNSSSSSYSSSGDN